MDRFSTPSFRSLLFLSWPTIATFSGLAARSLCDVWLAGRLGEFELAALAPAHLILLLILSLGYGSLYLVNTFASQAIGSDSPKEAGSYAWQGIWYSAIYGILALGAWIAAPWLFRFFNHSPEVAVHEVSYLRTACFSIGWQMITFAITNYFFALSRPLIPMVITLFSVLVHCLLGYHFVLGLEIPDGLGIQGIGLALVLSTAVHAILLILWMLLDPKCTAFGSRRFAFHPSRTWDILRTGIPLGARDLLDNVVWGIVVIWLIGSFGPVPMAAATVILVLNDTLMLPCDGIGSGMVTLMGRSLGRRDFEAAERWRITAMITVLGFSVLASGLIYLFRVPFFTMLIAEPEVAQLCISLAGFVPVLLLLYASYGIYDHALTASGDNLIPTLMNLVLTSAILGLGGWLFLKHLSHTASFGVWTLMSINLGVITLAFFFRWKSGAWKSMCLVGNAESAPLSDPASSK